MIFLSTVHATHGPSMTGHPTLTEGMKAWDMAKQDEAISYARLSNDYGDTILSLNRGQLWSHETARTAPLDE